MNDESRAFFDRFLSGLSDRERADMEGRFVHADYFCAHEDDANLCADLVLRGEKRATCGLAHWYDSGEERQPVVGDLLIVQNWQGEPVCLVEMTHIQRVRFGEVDEPFAREEGEGDKSLKWWRDVHWAFFANELAELGRAMSEDTEIVTERFRKLWPV